MITKNTAQKMLYTSYAGIVISTGIGLGGYLYTGQMKERSHDNTTAIARYDTIQTRTFYGGLAGLTLFTSLGFIGATIRNRRLREETDNVQDGQRE